MTTSSNTHPAKVVEPPLKFADIVDAKTYDKMRPPRPGGKFQVLSGKMLVVFLFSGLATRVNFHVTVMSIDSINEGSMVRKTKYL